jgi:hypothetical protein
MRILREPAKFFHELATLLMVFFRKDEMDHDCQTWEIQKATFEAWMRGKEWPEQIQIAKIVMKVMEESGERLDFQHWMKKRMK